MTACVGGISGEAMTDLGKPRPRAAAAGQSAHNQSSAQRLSKRTTDNDAILMCTDLGRRSPQKPTHPLRSHDQGDEVFEHSNDVDIGSGTKPRGTNRREALSMRVHRYSGGNMPVKAAAKAQSQESHVTRKPPLMIRPPEVASRRDHTKVSRQTSLGGAFHPQRAPQRRWDVARANNDATIYEKDLSIYSSCPDLVKKGAGGSGSDMVKTPVRPCKSSDGRLLRLSPSPTDSALSSPKRTSPKLLTVPDLFTTSFTHTAPPGERSGARQCHGPTQYRHSAPDIALDAEQSVQLVLMERGGSLKERQSLVKTFSHIPPRRTSVGEPSHGSGQHVSGSHDDAKMWHILDCLYVGNLRAAHHSRLLCKMKIRSILDLSNIAPEDVPPSMKNSVPCNCSATSNHAAAVLRISVGEADLHDIETHFDKMNKFIEGAREKQKKVLVFCATGYNLSMLVAMQYLMRMRGMNFRKAYSRVMSSQSDFELCPAYNELLQRLNRQLAQETKKEADYGDPEMEAESPVTRLPREAWTSFWD